MDGTRVALTDNVFAALARIRSETEHRRIWVDALCINQDDGVEKTAQVHMMHRIYRNCVECLIWMGEIDASALALSPEEATDAARGALDAVHILAGRNLEDPTPATLVTKQQKARAGHALYALLHTAWWNRIWTVQEATSPRAARVLWGPLSIPWDLLTSAAERLIRGQHPPTEILAFEDFFPGDGNYSFVTAPILGLVWAAGWVVAPHPPLEMLWRFRYRDSTDPRDKVYVILNLVEKGTFPLPSVTESDYGVDVAVLYTRVMLDLLRDEWGLRPLIGMRGERKSVAGLPSWVVDWSIPRDPGMAVAAFWEHDKFWGKYTADRGLPMLDGDRLTMGEFGEGVLNLNGVFFEKILVCGGVIKREESEERLREMVDEVIDAAVKERLMFRVVGEIYWREVLVSIVGGGYGNPEDIFEGATGDAFWRNEMLRFQRLFITENGVVGLGPSGACAGDEVWILSGGRSPFLFAPFQYEGDDNGLKKDEEASYHYTFKGDVFIPGIMSGEAVDSRIENQRIVHIH